MDGSVRVGTVAGIPVAANWSLLVAFWLIAWGLATGGLPSAHPGYLDNAYWAAGIAAALVFYIALLAHELSHAIAARRRSIEVDGITLWLFGGVTRMTGEPRTPKDAFRIAAAGPVASMAAAAAFSGMSFVLDRAGAPALLNGTAAWLARMNFLLAAFNLVPAVPLDGGRMLQSLLWWRRGDPLSAAVSAAGAGRVAGYALIALGLLQFSAGTGMGGLWLVFLGWFLMVAARSEQLAAEAHLHLEGVRVADVMTRDVVVAPGWVTVQAFLEDYGFRHPFSSFPLVRFDGGLAGLVTLNRLKEVPADQRRAVRVLDVATDMQDVPATRSDAPLLGIVGELSRSPDGRALVFDDGRLVGIVSPRDVASALQAAAIGRMSPRGREEPTNSAGE
jgi:Zn-dependent protease/CBS domain-containing protein